MADDKKELQRSSDHKSQAENPDGFFVAMVAIFAASFAWMIIIGLIATID